MAGKKFIVGLLSVVLLRFIVCPANIQAAAIVGEAHVYKQVDGRKLKLYVVKPPGWPATDPCPAIVIFHGGGWVAGNPAWMNPEAKYFAHRGMVAVLVEYRLLSRDTKTPPIICIQDARSAMRWVRTHALALGIDPQRIAAGGGSAGGYLAAFVGLMNGCDDLQDDLMVSPKADALVLWNPVFNNSPGNYGYERMGERYRKFSPADNITSNAPPAIVFFGTKDKYVSVATAKGFQHRMQECGVRCELLFYPGQGHGFFNKEPWLAKTLTESAKFFVSLGWMPSGT